MIRNRMKLLVTLVSILLFSSVTKADVWMPSMFSDNMVLQQKKELSFWGTADPAEKISVTIGDNQSETTTNSNGKWQLKMPAMKATTTPLTIVVSGNNKLQFKNVLVGEVWICSGQSNMDMTVAQEDRYWCGVYNEAQEVASANYPHIRVFDVDFTPNNKPQTDVTGIWEICSPATVGHFSAPAYFFARELYETYKIPVGLITTAFGASTAEAWISEKALKKRPNLKPILDAYTKKVDAFNADSAQSMPNYREALSKWKGNLAEAAAASGDVSATKKKKRKPRAPRHPDPSRDQHNPYVLYNGMVHALVPYSMQGAIWYQGESNGPTRNLYSEIMETLITDWRSAWQLGEFPFIYVQLANHKALITAPVKEDQMVTIRNEQLKNLSVPNTAMVVAIDNARADDYNNIHPKDKQQIGARLAVAAKAIVYNEKIEYMGPIFNKMKVKGNTATISFTHTGSGLTAKSDTVKGFALCGSDKIWHHANARIKGNKVMLSNSHVEAPIAVRYGWAKNPNCNLYNKEGLPASPF